jgi:hypothetical protein
MLALRDTARPSMLRSNRFLATFKRFLPMLAFFGGFLWDAFTLGHRVKPSDFWQLGGMLVAAALIIVWLARRDYLAVPEPRVEDDLRGRLRSLLWQSPYLLLQFLFGGIFSALFILYFKSSGHLGTILTAAALGGLLVANEFIGRRYGRRFTLTWGLFGLNAILLMNFVLPHAAGSLDPAWFYASTLGGVLLAHGLYRLAPGSPGRILPAWGVAAALVLAWHFDMLAPVPLVKREIVVGQQFSQHDGQYSMQVERAPAWQFWRDLASTVQVPAGGRLYGVSAVFAPLGVSAPLEHRWEFREPGGDWRATARIRFRSSGGREKGFRGYSWISNPAPGDWRLVVATQDGRTIGLLPVRVESGEVDAERIETREF